jgi:hypothetical protein
MKPQAAVRTLDVTVLERSYQLTPIALRQRPADPLKVAIAPAPQAAIARSSLTTILVAEAAAAEAPTMGLTGGPEVGAIAAVEATRIATPPEPHMVASTLARKLRNYDG